MSRAFIVPDQDQSIHHVYPIEEKQHITNGITCWCEPHLYRPCTACDSCGGPGEDHSCGGPGEDQGQPEACWCRDGDGTVRIDRIAPGDRVLVVHHFIPEDAEMVLQ